MLTALGPSFFAKKLKTVAEKLHGLKFADLATPMLASRINFGHRTANLRRLRLISAFGCSKRDRDTEMLNQMLKALKVKEYSASIL